MRQSKGAAEEKKKKGQGEKDGFDRDDRGESGELFNARRFALFALNCNRIGVIGGCKVDRQTRIGGNGGEMEPFRVTGQSVQSFEEI